MKHLLLILAVSLALTKVYSQSIRVAILDFENISGIAKYDGLGKAMSSMLISDIEANVSPKRLQLVERAQIQKVLKEQKFQTSVNVNKNSAVQAGKILGVNYLLVGDIYILNDQLIINARLTNTETGDIVFSKKQEGKLVSWLILKTNIAKNLAQSLSQPFTIPTIPDKEIATATITTFGNAIAAKDSGNYQMAENLSSTVNDYNPEFKYIEDLKNEIDNIKKQVDQNTQKISKLETNLDNLKDAFSNSDNIYFAYPTTKNQFLSNAVVDKRKGNYVNALLNYEKYFKFGNKYIDPYLDYISILELPEFEINKNNFLKQIKGSNLIQEKIAEILLSYDTKNRISKFLALNKNLNKEESNLVDYFLYQVQINFDKTNTPSQSLYCDKTFDYKIIYEKLIKLKYDTVFLNMFIDKIVLIKQVDEYINYSNNWAKILDNTIENLKKQGIEINTIKSTVKKLFTCSDSEVSEFLDTYYSFENKKKSEEQKIDFSTGKYYRFYNEKFYHEEYVEFNIENELKWINEKYNLNIKTKYQLHYNIIKSMTSDMNFEFKILDDKTLEYVNGGTIYIYKLKK